MANRKHTILRFLEERQSKNLPPPTFREICKECGISSLSVVSHDLDQLVKEGLVIRYRDGARGFILSDSPLPIDTTTKKSIRYCKECYAELSTLNIFKKRDQICINCKTARDLTRAAMKVAKEKTQTHKQIQQIYKRQKMAELYLMGKTLEQVGRLFNCTGENVRQQLVRAGVMPRRKWKKSNKEIA